MHLEKEFVGDRRSEYRHSICMDARVITPKTSFWAVATNISGSGLEIQCPATVNPKTKLMIALQLQEEFVFHCTVIWTLGDFIDGRWVYRVGVKTEIIAFKNTSAASKKEKAELVQKILPQIKAKGSNIGLAGSASA